MAEPADIAPAEAPPPQAPGPVRTSDGRVYVRALDGALQSVPEDQAERYLAEGRGQLATPEDVRERELQRQFGEGIGTEIRTGLEAAADTATLGGFSAATRVLGGDEAADAQRERYQRNPGAKVTGELASIGALTLATGGAGGAVGAVARATPAGLALRGGLAAERALNTGRSLSQIGALTAGGTVEGLLFGTGQGIQDIALSEQAQARTAEAALAHLGRTAGEGAVFGALGGLGAGAVFAGGGALARRARSALARGENGTKSLSRMPGARAGAGARASADAASGADVALTTRLSNKADVTVDDTFTLTLSDNRKPLQRLQDQASAAKRLDDQRGEFITGITRNTDEIHQATDLLAAEARRVKPSNAKRALEQMPIANYDATLARGDELLTEVRMGTEGMLQDALSREGLRGRGATSLAKVRDASEAARLALTLGKDEPAEVWSALNYYKGIVGRAADNARDSTAKEMLDAHYHGLQQYLEDTSLWGGMGKLNEGINPGWTRFLTANAVDEQFLSTAPRKSLSDPFRQGRQGDSAKMQALFDALGDVRGGTRASNFREWVEAQAEFARLADETYELSPRARKLANQVQKARDEILAKLDKAIITHADKRAFDELGGALNDVPFVATVTKSLKAGASSAANVAESVGVRAGAQAGADAAAGAAARGDLAVRAARLEGVRNAASSVASSIATAARGLVSASSRAVKSALPAAAATVGASKGERFARAYLATRDFEVDPHAAVRRAWRAQGDLGRFAPQLAAAQATRIAALGTLLASKLPQRPPPTIYGDEPEVPEVTPAERDEFMRYWRAANDPLSVIEDAADGRLSFEGVEVLRAGYPELYGSLQEGVLNALQTAEKKPPYRMRLTLGQLLDLPTDPGLEPDMLVALQASAASVAAPTEAEGGVLAPSRRSAPDLSGGQQTRYQSLQTERAR